MSTVMTYRRLLLFLQELDSEQLDCDLTIEDQDNEFFQADVTLYQDDDVLSAGHPYFCIATTNPAE